MAHRKKYNEAPNINNIAIDITDLVLPGDFEELLLAIWLSQYPDNFQNNMDIMIKKVRASASIGLICFLLCAKVTKKCGNGSNLYTREIYI